MRGALRKSGYTGGIDPKATFKVGSMNGREARESGLRFEGVGCATTRSYTPAVIRTVDELIISSRVTDFRGNNRQLDRRLSKNYASLNLNRWILPVAIFGNSVRNSPSADMARGRDGPKLGLELGVTPR